MNTNTSISDVIVHLHPDCSCDDGNKIEEDLRNHDGVVSVHFDTQEHPHAVVVAFNPDRITSQEVLAEVRKCDEQAMMAGM